GGQRLLAEIGYISHRLGTGGHLEIQRPCPPVTICRTCSRRMPSSASVCADPRCARITTLPASLRATCTATAPEACALSARTPPPEPTGLVPQNNHPHAKTCRSGNYPTPKPTQVSKLRFADENHLAVELCWGF